MALKKLGKKLAKKAANSVKKDPKMGLKVAIGTCIFIILLPIIIVEGMKNTILCFILSDCGGVDKELVSDSAAYLTKVRNESHSSLSNKDGNEKFLSADEVSESYINGLEDDKKDINIVPQAEMFLRILLALDQEVYLKIDSRDFKKGKPLDESIIDKSLAISKKQYDSGFVKFFLTDKFKDKDYKAKKDEYLLNYRLTVYVCYFTGNCDDDAKGSLPEGVQTSQAILNNGENFDNTTIRSLFQKFYEISFFKAVEGKIDSVPAGQGEQLFNEALADLTERFNEMYPSTVPGIAMNSFGWLVPLQEGTYHRVGGFGPRNCGDLEGCHSYHKGVDLGGDLKVPIYAAKSGVVVAMYYQEETAGSTIVIDHQDGFYTLYFHMRPEYRLVEVGQVVKQGQMIGGIGSEGASSGPHLHLEICTSIKESGFCKEGYSIDPESEGYYKGMFTSSKVASTVAEAKALFEKELNNKDRKNNPTMMPGLEKILASTNLGNLSVKYESGLDFNTACRGDVKITCGPWQIQGKTFTETFMSFLNEKYPIYYTAFSGHTGSPAAAEVVYQKLLKADKNAWINAQRHFIKESHYDKIIKKLKDNGIDWYDRPQAIHELVWSSAVQENNHFVNKIILPLKNQGYNFNTMSDLEILHVVYKARLAYHYNEPGNYTERFIGEYYDAVSLLTTGTFDPKKKSFAKGTPFPAMIKK